MEHNICRENLSAYLDNELSAGEKLSVESHLASCADCARELAELRKVSAVFKKHVMQPVPTALKEGVFAEKPAAPIFSGWLKPVLVLSAAACVVIIIVLPKFRQQDQVYSPALFSNAYEEKGAIQAAAADKSDGPVSSFSGEMSGGSVSAMSASSPRNQQPLGKGAYGQAKFAARGSSAGEGAYPAAASLDKASPRSMLASQAAGSKAGAFSGMTGGSAARPAWLEETIRRLQSGEKGNPPYTVWRYGYKGTTVYYLPPQCCDQYSRLYDEAGKLLCAPDGGMTGQGDGKCADFYKLRTGGELIWQDPRK